MSFIIDKSSGEDMKTFDIKNLKCTKTHHIMIGLCKGWIVLCGSEITEGVNEVHSKTEEDVVVDKHLLLRLFIGIEGNHVTINNSHCTFYCCIKEIVIDLNNGAVALESLH